MTIQELKDRVEEIHASVPADTQVFFDVGGMRAQVSELTYEVRDEATEVQVKG